MKDLLKNCVVTTSDDVVHSLHAKQKSCVVAFDATPRAGASQIGGGYCAPDALIEDVAKAIHRHRHDATQTDNDFAMYAAGKMLGDLRNVKIAIDLAKVALRAVAESAEPHAPAR